MQPDDTGGSRAIDTVDKTDADLRLAYANELDEAHDLLDQLCANEEDAPVADRLRALIATALGERVKAVLNPEAGKSLARWYLERTKCKSSCVCVRCRDARALT